jgi:secretion/DNA translocation related CpaE-like protein
MPDPSHYATVLVFVQDESLLPAVERLAVAANVAPLVTRDLALARQWWARSAMVVLCEEAASALAVAPVRRDRVVLVGWNPSTSLYERAVPVGAERVVLLPQDEAWLVEQLALAGDQHSVGTLAAVLGCRGGTGTSTLVAAVAHQAVHAGGSSVVVDADPAGGDLDVVLEMVDEPGLRWPDLASARGRLPAEQLAAALPRRGDVALLGTDPSPAVDAAANDVVPAAAVPFVLDALRRAFDVVVVDLPRWLPPPVRPVLDLADAVVLVTAADARGAAAAGRMASALGGAAAQDCLVVRTGPGATAEPAEVAALVGLPLAATLRHDRRVAAAAARGELLVRPGLRRAGQEVLRVLGAQRPAVA